MHKSVLKEETLQYLNIKPNGVYIDATFGAGGHTRTILEQEPTCTVVALDWDTRSLDVYALPLEEEFGERFIPIWGNFAQLYKHVKKLKLKRIDGILADFGTSQMQITERPGFSIYKDTPLDMRMSPGHQKVTAEHVIKYASEAELRAIFFEFGEERYSKKIAQAIVHDRREKPFKTTKDLASLIARIVPGNKKSKVHPSTRVFQALRIYVNKELDNIRSFLSGAASVLSPEGRLVCISFHSLEDRIVKQFFVDEASKGTLEILTKKAVEASPEERERNPSSRSAKLRAAMRIERPF